MTTQNGFRNEFLQALAPDDLAAVAAHLEWVDLPVRRRLGEAGRPLTHVFFLEHGISSTTATARHETPIEVGLVGFDGVTNLPALLGADRIGLDTFMQVAGAGHALDAGTAARLVVERPGLARLTMLAACAALAQMAATALSNSRGSVNERLARWLLMCDDRIIGEAVPITHEFIAIMLGVRRPGVTIALRDLERKGLVARSRGAVAVVDREGLIVAARGYYGAAELEHDRLMRLARSGS